MQLRAENISFRYDRKSPWILKNVDLTLDAGERVALTGPSGCGKSTLSKILAGYLEPTEGQVLLDGKPLPTRGYSPVQLIYQHPEQAVNPRWKMERTLKECWEPDEELLKEMGIESEWLKRWPSELSAVSCSVSVSPGCSVRQTRFLVCDEITTMLDVITQAQIWELLLERAHERDLGMAVVTHNMALAEKVCSRIVSLPDINGLR